MLSIDDFKPITMQSKPFFDSHYEMYPPIHSDNVFTTLVAWQDYAHYTYALIDDVLIIRATVNDFNYFRPPSGTYKKELFDELLELNNSLQPQSQISMITENVKQWMENTYHSYTFKPLPEYADYVYRAEDLAQLQGSDYRKIRNRLNKFVKNITYKKEMITEENIPEVKKFLKRWCIWRDCEDDPLLQYEKKAIMFSIDHFKDLGLSGIAIRVNDKIEAVCMFEKMNPDTIVVHFEKGSPYYDGIYKLINRETAELVKNNVTYINRESDMGNPGLRKAKESYRPDHMINVYQLIKK
jgi:uncharacterized protein